MTASTYTSKMRFKDGPQGSTQKRNLEKTHLVHKPDDLSPHPAFTRHFVTVFVVLSFEDGDDLLDTDVLLFVTFFVGGGEC